MHKSQFKHRQIPCFFSKCSSWIPFFLVCVCVFCCKTGVSKSEQLWNDHHQIFDQKKKCRTSCGGLVSPSHQRLGTSNWGCPSVNSGVSPCVTYPALHLHSRYKATVDSNDSSGILHCYEGQQICWIYEFGSWELPPLCKWSGKTKGKLPSHWEVYTRFKVGVIRLGGNARMYWICWSSSSAAFRTVTRHSYRRDVVSYKL